MNDARAEIETELRRLASVARDLVDVVRDEARGVIVVDLGCATDRHVPETLVPLLLARLRLLPDEARRDLVHDVFDDVLLAATGRYRGVFRDDGKARAIDTEIYRAMTASRRREDELERMVEAASGACCPLCFHGPEWSSLVEKHERAEEWLSILLLKRAEPGDDVDAERIAAEIPKERQERIAAFKARRDGMIG